ncbi:MAG: ABC transporter permease [Bacteroidales bacterium]|nr:ABC transporter permease [Bacteroidales bacterium]
MKSYLKFLSRNKLYTAIEAVGLIVSLALVLIIGMWVRDQLGLAGTKAGENQLYLLSQKEESMISRMVYRDIDALRTYPEIRQAAAFIPVSVTVGNGEERRKMNVLAGDSSILDLVSLSVVSGSTASLSSGSGIALSASAARQLFLDTDPVGRVLTIGDNCEGSILSQEDPMTVAAVVEDPDYTLLPDFAVFCPEEADISLVQRLTGIGLGFMHLVFVELVPGVDAAAFCAKYPDLKLASGSDLYFTSESSAAWRHGKVLYLVILIVLGIVLLLSALLNYVNLSSAISGSRAKEMATRRLLGESRKEIVRRIVLESVLFAGVCYIFSVLLAIAVVPVLNSLFANVLAVPFRVVPNPFFWLFSVGLVLLVGIVGGLVPASILSSYRPIDVVSGAVRRRRKATFNKVCIILQTALAMVLTAMAFAMVLQLRHLESLDLGIDPEENLFYYRGQSASDPAIPILADRLKALPSVQTVASSVGIPTHFSAMDTGPDGSRITVISCDSSAFRMLGFRVTEAYTEVRPGTIWISEELQAFSGVSRENPDVSLLLPRNMLGITAIGGVVKDFRRLAVNANDFLSELGPSFHAVRIRSNPSAGLLVKTTSDHTSFRQDFLRVATEVYSAGAGVPSFGNAGGASCGYLEEIVAADYEDLHRYVQLVTLLCVIAIFLAMLGLFAMSTWFASVNTKEIAIRKVHGNSIGGETRRMIRNYLSYVAVAAVVAIPVSVVLIRRFLETYPERISGYAGLFVVTVLIIFAAAFLSVLWQTLKAARTNPAAELKKE